MKTAIQYVVTGFLTFLSIWLVSAGMNYGVRIGLNPMARILMTYDRILQD